MSLRFRSLVIALSFIYLLIPIDAAHAQRVGINILIPDTSAALQVFSDSLGFLPPTMNTQQRDNITKPADGLIIYNTDDSTVQYYNGQCWLPTYQADCNDCYFNLSSSSLADTIDRTQTDSVQITLTVSQTNGNPQNIAFAVVGTLPTGLTSTIMPNPILGSGNVDVTFHATPYVPAGTYPIVIQALCGGQVRNFIYSLTLTPCYILNVNNTTTNYDVSVDLYATYPSAPTSQPVCVVSIVQPGVDVTSPVTTQPAFTSGNLPAGSVLGIVNNGNIIGMGGAGGTATDPANGYTGEGEDGGNAIEVTVDASIQNNFNIYGGGGGGNAMAFGLTYDLNNLVNLPGINLPTIGILIGAGGGGGAGGGAGGNIPTLLGIQYYIPGTNGTPGQFGVPGDGGVLNFPINVQQGPANISINPNAYGGDGGAYGYPGTQGAFQVTISISITVTIPIIGPITIPVLTNLNVPIPVPIPAAGDGGYAIKHNGNTINIPDNLYNTSFLKGRVGP